MKQAIIAIAKIMWRIKNGKIHPEYEEFLRLKEMHLSETGLNAILEGSAVPALIESFGDCLTANPEAKNYLSVDVFHPKHGRLEVLIQKAEGKTPAQINVELKREIAALKEQIAKAGGTEGMTYHTNLPDNIADWQDDQRCYGHGVSYEGPSLIRKLSDKYGSLRKLCKVCGLSSTYLSRISTGKEIMSFSCYLKLAALDGWRRESK